MIKNSSCSHFNNKNIVIILLLFVFSFLFFSYRMGNIGLTDPDEAFYAQTAKEMLQRGDFLTPVIFAHPQFEKPIFFYWLLIAAFKLFGFTEWAVRFWPAVFGALGIVFTFLLGKLLFGRRVGLYAALILTVNFLYLGLSRVALTDIVLSVFILLTMFFFSMWYFRKKIIFCLLAYLFSAFAVLTKGPIGVIVPFSIIIICLVGREGRSSVRRFLLCRRGWLVFLAVVLPWYIFISLKFGRDFLYGFFVHENIRRFFIAEHHSFNHWYFYPAVILLGFFPWSGWLSLFFTGKTTSSAQPKLFLQIWFWVTLLFFTGAQSKLSSYILPLFPALSILLADSLSYVCSVPQGNKRFKLAFSFCALINAVILGSFIYSISWIKENYPDLFIPALLVELIIGTAICLSTVLLFRRKCTASILVNVSGVFIAVVLSFNYLIPKLEGAFSDRLLLRRLSGVGLQKDKIICNKMFVRGVHYYSGRPVAVINEDKHPFYTSHPIEVVSSDLEIRKFFSGRENIVCVVKESDLDRIARNTTGSRENVIVYRNGSRTVMFSKPLYPM